MTYRNDTGYPSVTEIIKPFIDTAWFTEDARARGSAVHQAVAAYLNGVWSPPLPAVWQGYLDAAKRWIDAMVDRVVVVEQRLVDESKGYCGKPDLIAILKGDDLPTLIDWKTAAAYQRWWGVQLCAYMRLTEWNMIIVERGLSVRLGDNGKCRVDECSDITTGMNVFQGMLNAHRYFNN